MSYSSLIGLVVAARVCGRCLWIAEIMRVLVTANELDDGSFFHLVT